MEKSDFYKEEYLKYKKDYIILKNQTSGFGSKILPEYYCLVVALDENTYVALRRLVIHNMLSIETIKSTIIGCGLSIDEETPHVIFHKADEYVNMALQHIRRKSGSTIQVVLPEYIYKDSISPSKNIIATLIQPYKYGAIFYHAGFVNTLSSIIVKNLKRRDATLEGTEAHIDFKKYKDIRPEEAFYGIMIFKYNNHKCRFIEAYILSTVADDQTSNMETHEMKINRVADFGDGGGIKKMLITDPHAIDPRDGFVTFKGN